jgi:hypothetical protein
MRGGSLLPRRAPVKKKEDYWGARIYKQAIGTGFETKNRRIEWIRGSYGIWDNKSPQTGGPTCAAGQLASRRDAHAVAD